MTRSSNRRREWREELAEQRRGHPRRVQKGVPFGRVLRLRAGERGVTALHATRRAVEYVNPPAGLYTNMMSRRPTDGG